MQTIEWLIVFFHLPMCQNEQTFEIDLFMLTCQMKVACCDLYICKHPKVKVHFQFKNVVLVFHFFLHWTWIYRDAKVLLELLK